MKKFFTKGKIVFFVLALVLVASFYSCRRWKAKMETLKLSSLVSVRPHRGRLIVKTQSTGIVEPENRVSVASPVSGRVEKVLVKEGSKVKKGQVLAWISSNERVALLDSLELGESSEEERKLIEEAYNMLPVVAPIDGMVIKRSAEPGQSTDPAKEIIVISDRLIVKAFVDETDIGRVRKGQNAEFYLDAFPKKKCSGRVLSIAHESVVKEGVTVYEVKILPRRCNEILRSGMTADVLIVTDIKGNVLYLPKKSIKYRDGDAFVTVKNKAGKIVEKKVELGETNDEQIEIISGADENSVVYYSTGIPPERMTINLSAN